MSSSARLAIPFLLPGQAQKEFYHNEALQLLDVLVAGAVEEPPRQAPPASPAVGACYIIAAGPTGDWVGKAGQVAAFTAGGWRYLAPVEGMELLVRSTSTKAAFRLGAWEIGQLRGDALLVSGSQVVGPRSAAIASPSGGSTTDAEARAAIAAILAALRQHGLIAT